MKVNLFGVGTKSTSPAITAQRRINCRVDVRKEADRSAFALVGRPGLNSFITSIGVSPSRGMWAVNTLPTPLLFTVHSGTLYSITNSGTVTSIGTINTISGDVSMADDGKYLVLVDGTQGWWYNMQTPGALTRIVDGNFTTSPETVCWQDNYFIVTSGSTRQWQLSQISPSVDPAVWPSVQIAFAGAGAGALQGAVPQHSVLNVFGDVYSQFYQDTGSPDLPYAEIPGSAAEFGLASTFSLAKFDNSVVGLFRNTQGGVNISRLAGFNLRRLSDQDIEQILANYSPSSIGSAQGYSFMNDGHPLYIINFADNATWMYDGLSNIWTEVQDPNGDIFWGQKFAVFQGRLCVSDYRNGNIYQLDQNTYSDNGSAVGMEVWTKHIYNENKYIGIPRVEIEMETGVGLATGQGENPVIDLQVSKDGGNSFYSVGFSSFGPIGEYTQRVVWNSLGAARDWVLKLRITDPVKRVITGASAEIIGGPF